MRIFSKTDIGKAREVNEDYFYIPIEDEIKLFILADGMGGYNGGEIASKLASNAVKSYIANNFDTIPKDNDNILKLIQDAIEYANMAIYDKSKTTAELEGMGTTLEICLIYNNKVYIGHVGDSRVYRIRKNNIKRLTTDHSYVQKLVKDGTITEEQAMVHPKKNMLTKALGCTSYIEPDIMYDIILDNDIIIMTTDGLTNMIQDDQIYNIVKQDINLATDRLLQQANELGGYDNITVIIIEN